MPLRSERRFISKSKISSGMLVEFSYQKIKDKTRQSYVAIVIDPNKDDYLHALLINDLSDKELLDMITKLGEISYNPQQRDKPLIDLQNDDAYDKYLGIKNQRRYRTFLIENISSLRQILIGKITESEQDNTQKKETTQTDSEQNSIPKKETTQTGPES